MITLDQYVGVHKTSPDWNDERKANAIKLLLRVNSLMGEMEVAGVKFPINPATKSQVSGQTFGGFRPQNCPQGAPNSSHKEGMAVDIYDPENAIDKWISENADRLEAYGIYIEHQDATRNWCHMSTRAPRSGKHIFYP